MPEALANFHFIRPGWLLLAPLTVAIWWWWQRTADPLRGWRAQMDSAFLEVLATQRDHRGKWRTVAPLVAWLIAVVVIAGPTWKPEPNPFAEETAPLIVLLKADVSMDKGDVAPSRLERARLKIADLADARKGQPLALIAYAGSAHLVLPPTKDTGVVAQMAAQVSPDVMPAPGDHLELALAKAGDLLAKQETTGSTLIVADSVDGDLTTINEVHQEHGKFPVQFLAVNEPGSSEDDALRKAAHGLKAKVEPLSADNTDIAAIVRTAARPPISRSALMNKGTHWQEGGWYLLPVLALFAALVFRRETTKPEEAAA